MNKPVKIIDLFSGPGGLGEGFSACKNADGSKAFEIAVSIEKEKSAHSTLLLRAFYRLLNEDQKAAYFDFMKGKLGNKPSDKLYSMYPEIYEAAQKEALCLELGKDNDKINKAISDAIQDDDCILIGGPPCQAYSLAGRSRNMGIEGYDAKDDHRNFLYLEYLKVIARFQPQLFVMENVKGMLSAKIDGKPIFDSIYRDLKSPCTASSTAPSTGKYENSYKLFSLVTPNLYEDDLVRDPRDFIIKAENYSVPQNRHRVIILGIREDLAHKWDNSMLLKVVEDKTTVSDVLNGMPKLRSGLSKVKKHTDKDWVNAVASIKNDVVPALEKSNEIKHRSIAVEINKTITNFKVPTNGQGSIFGQQSTKVNTPSTPLNEWFHDKKLEGFITNHETRGHIEKDLNRYLFCSAWAACAEKENWETKTPKSKDYIDELVPNHTNFKSGKFADRFRVQANSIPATTITSHISKDGHYYIHPDPKQCRSLTVREAARIQTFPDNYFFVGNRTEQYVQVGNAVPPYLAIQIASKVLNII
ncbi:DNA cytosine methyltransferase [Marinomonas sp. PE14-40]|uniref:DNA cytosine methyltransferase n=1 Tax=Marinomonas sp. PE14-40 TaxID=3060621 RepID=UPI003F66A1FC